MEKLVYVFWERPSVAPSELSARLLDDVAPALLALEPLGLSMNLDDAQAQVPPPVPVPDDELPVRAQVSLWLAAHDRRAPFEAILTDVGVRRAGYLVTESVYEDYGETPHRPSPRDWPDGTRSPGIVTLGLLRRRTGLDDATFYGHWYGHQSPMSGEMQPRMRYVRNTVARALTLGAPPLDGIVEEMWPSPEHLRDLPTFFGATDADELAENIRIMLDSMRVFADADAFRSFTLGEYLLRTP